MSTTKLSRTDKARQLLLDGKVHLLPGAGYALVDGSNGEQYRVTREACSCKDWEYRHESIGDCAHRIAVKQVCAAYREVQRQVRETGFAAMPEELDRALRPVPAPAPKRSPDDDQRELFVPSEMPAKKAA